MKLEYNPPPQPDIRDEYTAACQTIVHILVSLGVGKVDTVGWSTTFRNIYTSINHCGYTHGTVTLSTASSGVNHYFTPGTGAVALKLITFNI